MANTRRLTVEIIGDSRSAERAFHRANKAAGTFGSRLRSIGKLAALGVGGALIGIAALLRRGFREFMEGNVVMQQTQAVLHSTGGVAQVTAKHVDALAGSLSRMTGIDDEAIATGENMLLTFTNIRNAAGKNNKIFDQATRAVLDLSQATGKDMRTSAIMVGKALNDLEVNSRGTITGWSALRRVGVMVTANMQRQGAAFIRAGKPLKAQRLLLRELRTEFGGSAKAFGRTLPGAFAKFKNALDEVTGAFAEGLAPVVQRVANLLASKMANPAFVARVRTLGTLVGEKLVAAFKAIAAWFKANWPTIMADFKALMNVAEKTMHFVEWVDKHKGPSGKDIFGGILGAPGKAAHALSGTNLMHVGGGGNRKGDVHVHGPVHVNANTNSEFIENLQRLGKRTASRTRGRHKNPIASR
jgi:acid phosphatase family membrane protein YuiD/xanthosine utilization system XapX-like protein